LQSIILNRLEQRKSQGLFRERKIVQSANGKTITLKGRSVLNFASNNYLDLAQHPKTRQAFSCCAEKYGMGSGASQFISGYTGPAYDLEQHLAAFTGRDKAIIFNSGYMANLAAVTALADRHSVVLADKLAHASLIDAAILSRARFRRYKHTDPEALNIVLGAATTDSKLVLTDGVFSMDGDIAPLPGLAAWCKTHKALLLVDDAHGIGVLGQQKAAGTLEHFTLSQQQVPLLVGTFGKALGLTGAFVAGPYELIELVLQFGRSGMYTTAIMPPLAAAIDVALELIETEQWRREKLNDLIDYFRREVDKAGLRLLPSITPIQPLLIGSNSRAMDISEQLFNSGIFVPAIRTPTVPEGSARLRISLTVGHNKKDIHKLVMELSKLIK